MKNVIKKVVTYIVLFVSLYMCSIIVVKLFTMMNIQFDNISNAAFNAALFSIIIIGLINFLTNKYTNKGKGEDEILLHKTARHH